MLRGLSVTPAARLLLLGLTGCTAAGQPDVEKQTPRAWARERGQKGRNVTSKTQISSLGFVSWPGSAGPSEPFRDSLPAL